MEAGDADALAASIAKAKALGEGNDMLMAEKTAKKLQKEHELSARISSAIEADDRKLLKELLEEAKKAMISNDKVQQARVVVEREALVAETLQVQGPGDHAGLERNERGNAALARARPEVGRGEARRRGARHAQAVDELLTLEGEMSAVSVKAHSPSGLRPRTSPPSRCLREG